MKKFRDTHNTLNKMIGLEEIYQQVEEEEKAEELDDQPSLIDPENNSLSSGGEDEDLDSESIELPCLSEQFEENKP